MRIFSLIICCGLIVACGKEPTATIQTEDVQTPTPEQTSIPSPYIVQVSTPIPSASPVGTDQFHAISTVKCSKQVYALGNTKITYTYTEFSNGEYFVSCQAISNSYDLKESYNFSYTTDSNATCEVIGYANTNPFITWTFTKDSIKHEDYSFQNQTSTINTTTFLNTECTEL